MGLRTAGIRYLQTLAKPTVDRAREQLAQARRTTSCLNDSPLQSLSAQCCKTAENIILTAALLPLAVPVSLAITAIKAARGSPILCRQARIGQGAAYFTILKFKTIYNSSPLNILNHFLRCSSLDELPQLLNIIRGEMHFIGPRPLLSADDDKLATAAQIPNFSLYRSLTRPGLIPPTVLIGRQSAHDEDRAALDLYYLQNWSPLLDLKLVCFAIPAVLLGWGAK